MQPTGRWMRRRSSTPVRVAVLALALLVGTGTAAVAQAPTTTDRSDRSDATTTTEAPPSTDAATSTSDPEVEADKAPKADKATTTTDKPRNRPNATDPAPEPSTTTTIPAQASGTWITAVGYNPEWHSINPPWLPPVPLASGTGRRIVYSKGQQRVWLMEDNGYIANTHLVSGRMDIPAYGLYHVYSKSYATFATHNPSIVWNYMVRFAVGPLGGGIGLHEIPWQYGRPVQSAEQLGQPLSGGCLRQTHEDAIFVWNWAPVGTPVVVVP